MIVISQDTLILIVDDLSRNLQVLGSMLRDKSYQVAAVENGEQALKFVKQRVPDLVLLDIMMPGIDGFEVCQQLKSMEPTRDIPIIFISALGDVQSKLKGFAVGGVDFITKPFQQEEVLARVENHLKLKRAQEKIKRNKEKFRKYIDSAPDAVFVVNGQGKYIEVNQAACELTGYNEEELLNMYVGQLNAQEESLKISEDFKNLIDEGELHKELVIERKDGVIFYTLLNAVKLTEDRYIGFKKNITDRKLAEMSLKESEEKFRQLTESIHEVFFMVSVDLKRMLYVGPAYEEVWQRSRENLYKKPLSWLKTIYCQDRDRVSAKLKQTFKKGIEFEEKFRIIRGDGSTRWIEARFFPVYNQKDEVYRYAGVAEDITEKEILHNHLEYRMELEGLIMKFSKSFINLELTEISSKIEEALETIARFIEVEYSYIYLLSEDKEHIVNSYKWWSEEFEVESTMSSMIRKGQASSLKDFDWLLRKLTQGETLEITDIEQLPKEADYERKLFEYLNVDHALIIPLIYKNELTGILGFDSIEEEHKWSSEIISLFEIAGDIFINAIERKRREEKLKNYHLEVKEKNMVLEELYNSLNQEFEKGSKLHSQFLPDQLPKIEGLSFGAYYQPADKLGGDFYDVIEIAGQLIVYIADVSGHGLDGSMLNIFLRESINSYLIYKYQQEQSISPAAIINFIIDKYRQESFPDDYFICLLLGVLDLETMEFVFSNAGFQILPQLVSTTGEVTSIYCSGLPVSKAIKNQIYAELNASGYQEKTIELTAGETVFMTTDGLIEERVKSSQYGELRLQSVLSRCSHLPPETIIDCINKDFKDFTGSLEAQDDITFFIIKRNN
ncbi:PAS domain S-box protein [Fuchsiella alkaliacetigena]|uniref:PAS domain S-box protein n=1 Tax=Fuchsiella alkaliacetigena TaxID=957042 RepID=UPI00200B85FD|nr:PAS domain S-box protein [Fuchsiella alkaliacetigena]MCK8823799.1 PAS domain S-box protein [Fuchsiella alkaliacetigena]